MKGQLLSFVLCLLSFSSFMFGKTLPPPVVDFTFNNNNACSGTPIQFTSTVSGDAPFTYAWNFGDSGTSSQASVSHSFVALGCGTQNFSVSLTVTDANNQATTIVKTVTVKQRPDINFVDVNNAFDPFNNCQGANPGSPAYSITLGNNSTSSCIANINVNWGDGNSQSNPTFPVSHTYANLGAYPLTITVTGTNGCTSVKNFVVKNISNPSGSLTSPGGTTNLCAPTSNLQFAIGGDWGINSDDTVYTIDYGDGTPILTFTQAQLESSPYFNVASPIDSNDYPIPHSYLISSCPGGSFTAQLVITNACSPTPFTTSNIVILKKPEANFIAPASACVNSNVPFTNTTVSGFNQNCNQQAIYTWDFGDGSPPVTTSPTLPQNISHQFLSAGTFNVTLTAQGFCGSSTISKPICIEPPLTPLFTVNQNEGCAPLPVNTSNTTSVVASCATTTYTWSVTHTPSFCGGAIAAIPNQTTTNASYNFTEPGTYTITLSTTNSCGTTQASQTVTVKKPPTVSINAIGNLCGAGTINPQASVNACAPASSTLTYAWSFPGGTPATSSASNPGPISYSATGPHTVSLIVSNECGNSTVATQTFTLNAAPSITNTDFSQTICSGTSMTAIALNSSIPGTTYTWTAAASAGVTGFQSNGTAATIPAQIINYSGSGTGTLTYTVTPTFSGCSGATVQFQVQITPAPAITAQPQPQTVCQNATPNTLSISINAGSVTPTYQWYSNTVNNSSGGSPILGATSSSYVPPTTSTGTIYYYVVASLGSGGCASLTSQVAALTVEPLPQITTQPQTSQQICAGGTASALSVSLSGGTGSTTYQWYSNNSSTSTGGVAISGATSATYTPPTFVTAGTYYYYVIAGVSGAGCGNVTSQVSEVIVVPDPTINTQPLPSQILCQGASAQVHSVNAAGGIGTLTYQWFSNTSNATTGGTLIPGATNNTFTPPTTAVGTVYYYCVISQTASGCGVTSAVAAVTVNTSPSVTTQPIPSQVCLGGTAQTLGFTTANGIGTASYQWYASASNSLSGTPITGETNPTFVPPTNVAGSTWYYCEITFSGISGPCATINTLPTLVEVTPGAQVSQQPIPSQNVCTGASLSSPLTVAYTGGSGTPQYQWYSNTVNANSGGVPVGANSDSYLPPAFSAAGSYYYYVSIQLSASGCAPVVSDVAAVVVVNDPVVTSQPIVSQTLCPNETASVLSVSVTGGIGTSYAYQWFASTSSSAGSGSPIAGATDPDYTPPSNIPGTLYYYCVISQPGSIGCNAESNMAVVTISPAPAITAQPISQTICSGDTINPLGFTVTNGVGVGTYQWFSNTTSSNVGGTAITGANGPTYLPDGTTVGTFYYYCIVTFPDLSGSCSSVATDAIQITVEQNPVISDKTETICSGNNFLVAPITVGTDIVPLSTTYTWSVTSVAPVGAITGAADQVVPQNNINQTLTNITIAPALVTYLVTPLAGNCPGQPFNVSITVNPAISPNITLNDNLCFGADSASITTNVTGGIPFPGSQPYQFAWTGPNGFSSSATSISNLEPGNYSVVITDAGGCPFSQTYTISEPAQLVFDNTVKTDVTCNGAANGSITVAVLGGTPGYTYTWTKDTAFFSNTQNLTGLSPGVYEVTVSDTYNCDPITASFTITEPQPLFATVAAQTNVECFGESTGSLIINASGGTPNSSGYSFSWTGPNGFTSANQNLTGLFAGTYDLTVTDANGCQFNLTATILQSPEIIISYTTTEITCYGANDADMTVQLSGGVGPYTFTWSNLSTSLVQTDLSAGDYTITVTDALGCQKSLTINIPEAPIFTVAPVVIQISCHGANDGSIQLNLTGGIAPVTLVWSDGSTAGLTRNGLGPGVYTATITDSKPCQIVRTFVITDPQPLVLSAQIQNALDCNASSTGAIDLLVSGGTPPYTYGWSNGNTTEDISGLTNGNYAVTVTDSRGCSAIGQYTVLRPDPLTISVNTQTDFDCDTREVDLTFVAQVTGGVPPVQLQWSSGTISGANNEVMQTDSEGIVEITATDALGCVATYTLNVEIPELGYIDFQPESVGSVSYGIFAIQDPITFTSNLTGDYQTIIWDFGDGTFSNELNPVHTYFRAGSYVVTQTVTYPFGCQYTKTITLLVEEGYFLVIPTAFTPNNDDINDNYRPVSKRLENIRMDIYDSWGSMIYSETGDALVGWNGSINSVGAENGNYYCKVTARTFYGRTITETKTFVLIK